MNNSTITAISTPPGRGGIGIIRLSGDQAFSIIKTISDLKIDLNELIDINQRKLIHGFILDNQGHPIDEVLLGLMPSHRSYTGEPVVEINCHGGRAVLSKILDRAMEAGAIIAVPGEFTRRAVEKGRIDLVQAEAINDVINARSDKALKIALQQMEGGLSKRYQMLKDQLLQILGEMDAVVDFELEDPLLTTDHWKKQLKDILSLLEAMLKSSKIRKYMDHGFWITLVGPPNAGKSSLFNAILNIERAIVCDVPGTTRDHISEMIEIEGVEVKITDTAGIRETESTIEAMSIMRTREQIKAADLILYVLDQNQPLSHNEIQVIEDTLAGRGIIVLNKADLPPNPSVEALEKHGIEFVRLSTLKNNGIDGLLDKIANRIAQYFPDEQSPIISSLRQRTLIEKAFNFLNNACQSLDEGNGLDIVIYEIEKAIEELKEIMGDISNEEIYEHIFSKFCIGK